MAPLPVFSQSARLPAICSGDRGSRERGAVAAADLGCHFGVPPEAPFWMTREPLQPRLVDDLDIINSIYSKWVTFGIKVS